jgi:outer membrane lipoprotein-sorting protein
MIKIVYRWVLGFFFLSCTCLAPFSQDNYLVESEKKARQILAKAIEALGGELFRKTQDITRNGRLYQFRKDDLQGLGQFESYDKFPLKQRSELGKKKEIININNGDKGWKIEYKVVKDQSDEEIKNFQANMKHNLDYVLRFRLTEKGMRFRYLGKSRINLDQVEGIQLIDGEEDKIKIFVNANNFLPVKMEYQTPAFMKRWPTEDERFFYNYHDIQGVQIPFKVVRFSNGYKSGETQIDSVKINSGLPDSLFVASLKK